MLELYLNVVDALSRSGSLRVQMLNSECNCCSRRSAQQPDAVRAVVVIIWIVWRRDGSRLHRPVVQQTTTPSTSCGVKRAFMFLFLVHVFWLHSACVKCCSHKLWRKTKWGFCWHEGQHTNWCGWVWSHLWKWWPLFHLGVIESCTFWIGSCAPVLAEEYLAWWEWNTPDTFKVFAGLISNEKIKRPSLSGNKEKSTAKHSPFVRRNCMIKSMMTTEIKCFDQIWMRHHLPQTLGSDTRRLHYASQSGLRRFRNFVEWFQDQSQNNW